MLINSVFKASLLLDDDPGLAEVVPLSILLLYRSPAAPTVIWPGCIMR